MDAKKAKVITEAEKLGIQVDPSMHEYQIEALIAKKLRNN